MAKFKIGFSFHVIQLVFSFSTLAQNRPATGSQVAEICWKRVFSSPCRDVIRTAQDVAEVKKYYTSFVSCDDYQSLRSFGAMSGNPAFPEKYRNFAMKVNQERFSTVAACANQVAQSMSPSAGGGGANQAGSTYQPNSNSNGSNNSTTEALQRSLDMQQRIEKAGDVEKRSSARKEGSSSQRPSDAEEGSTEEGVESPSSRGLAKNSSSSSEVNSEGNLPDYAEVGGSSPNTSVASNQQAETSLHATPGSSEASSAGAVDFDNVKLSPQQVKDVATAQREVEQQLAAAKQSEVLSDEAIAAFNQLTGKVSEKVISMFKNSAQLLAASEKVATKGASQEVSSKMTSAIQTYIKASESCAAAAERANMACIEERSPAIKTVMNIVQASLPVLQAVTGANNACSSTAKTLGTINKAMMLATAVCGGFKAMCSASCANTAKMLQTLVTSVDEAAMFIAQKAQAAMISELNSVCAPMASSGTPAGVAAAKACEAKTVAYYKPVTSTLVRAKEQAAAAFKADSTPVDKDSVGFKIAQCDKYTETIAKTLAGVMSLAQSQSQAKRCAAMTAANSQDNKCENPANAGTLECLCKRSDLASRPDCIAYNKTGCPALQLKNSTGVCVDLATACKELVNANQAQCTANLVLKCSNPAYSGTQQCLCANNPDTPTCRTGSNPSDLASGAGLVAQKMTTGRGNPASTSGGGDVAGLGATSGSDGATKGRGVASSGPGAAIGGYAGGGGGLSGGGLPGSGGSEVSEAAKDASGKGGVSSDASGGSGGGGSFGGIDWGREKNKADALEKLKENKEKARLSGADVLKNNGITGPTGRTLWEKVSSRYRESRGSLLGE